MTTDHSSSDRIEEVALVVAALDPADAERLLQQFPDAIADRIRGRVEQMADADVPAQQQAVARLLGERARRDRSPTVSPSIGTAQRSPFEFLQRATPETLSRLLLDQHPQVVAVVVSHLPPDAAAEVMNIMPTQRQAEILARVAHLDEMAPAALAALEDAIESLITCYGDRHPGRASGIQAVEAIMAHVDRRRRADLLASLEVRDEALQQALAPSVAQPQRAPAASSPPVRSADVPAAPAPPHPHFEFRDLERLAPGDWPALLQATGSELMLLAMAGAPREVVEPFLALVPRKTARSLQRRMEQIGPIQLQDIEHAQRRVARIAGELVATGQIAEPRRRHFAAAV